MKPTIIVVGAGASGLVAARELSKKNYHVIVLESQKETGGRIQTHMLEENDGVVEGGAEFIHGKLPVTFGLCKEGKIAYLPAEGKMYRKEKNNWVEETEMIDGWDELIERMGSQKEDLTLNEFLKRHYSEDRFTDLRRQVNSYVQGFDLADPEKVSLRSLYEEWSHEDQENFRITGGYHTLIRFLEEECYANGCVIVRDDAVKQIDWQRHEVMAYTACGKKYSGDKILITVPVKILTDIAGTCAINFTPPIDDRIKAAANIGYGTVIKVAFYFNAPLWKEDTRFIFSEEMFPTWWTQLPLKNNLLTGWVGGPKASGMSMRSDAALKDIAVTSLSNIFNVPAEEIKGSINRSFVFNWQQFPNAMGAYSYDTLHTPAARKLLNTPLEETVFFAGEGLYEGRYPGTVEAALAHGKQAAQRMMDGAPL